MTTLKVLIALCLGAVVYVFVSLFGGQDGFWAASQLMDQQEQISGQTSNIIAINDELSLEYAALRQDPEIIGAYARKLGYVGDAEKLIKIIGLPSRGRPIYDPGTVLRRQKIEFIPEWICKLSGIVVSALVFVVFMLITVLKACIREKRT
jgi:cell division protein FtsB